MSPDTIATLAAAAVIIGFLWSLHRDIRAVDRRVGDLAERIAKLEGAVEILTRFLIDRERQPGAIPMSKPTGRRKQAAASSTHRSGRPVAIS